MKESVERELRQRNIRRYDPDKYHRRSIRLDGYDYAQEGAYFVTICTKGRELYFAMYPELRNIVQAQWKSLPERFPYIVLDAFVIMPNHLHAIIIVGATLAVAPNQGAVAPNRVPIAQTHRRGNPCGCPIAERDRANDSKDRAGLAPAPTSLGNIGGAFKSLCVTDWLKYIEQNNLNAVGSIWQRNYYERIIRNEKELNQVREYIANNPLKWSFDRENPNQIIDSVYLAEWKWLEGEA